MTPRDREALVTIGESAAKVRSYVERAGQGWATNDMAIDAIAKRFEEIGELAKRVSADVLQLMPAVDWRALKGMREVLAHDYGHVQIGIIESIVTDDLDVLTESVASLLDEQAYARQRGGG